MVENIKECKCGCNCKIMKVLFSILLIVLIGYGVFAIIEKSKKIEGKNASTITISRTGTVYAVPNLAQIDLSIITEGKEVNDVIQKNNEKSSAVIEKIKAQGIDEADIKTTYYNVYPLYEWHKEGDSLSTTGTRVLTGYEAVETINVKVREVEKIGGLIEEAVRAGANQVGDLQFIVENEEVFKAQARAKAIIEAKAEAIQTAQVLGVKLGEIVSFSENSSYVPLYDRSAVATDSSAISAGENKIDVTVNIVFEIK